MIGKNIKTVRRLKDIKQEDLAANAEISISYLSRIESGLANPSVEVLEDIAKALEIDPGYLFGELNFEACKPKLVVGDEIDPEGEY